MDGSTFRISSIRKPANRKTELESLKALKLELMQNDFDWCNIGSQRKSRIQLELSGWKKMYGKNSCLTS